MGGVANFGVGGGCLHPNYGGTPLDGEENNNIRKRTRQNNVEDLPRICMPYKIIL